MDYKQKNRYIYILNKILFSKKKKRRKVSQINALNQIENYKIININN